MRQFVYESEENENSEGIVMKKKGFNSEVIYLKKKRVKVLNNVPKVRIVHNLFKNASVTDIVE